MQKLVKKVSQSNPRFSVENSGVKLTRKKYKVPIMNIFISYLKSVKNCVEDSISVLIYIYERHKAHQKVKHNK